MGWVGLDRQAWMDMIELIEEDDWMDRIGKVGLDEQDWMNKIG